MCFYSKWKHNLTQCYKSNNIKVAYCCWLIFFAFKVSVKASLFIAKYIFEVCYNNHQNTAAISISWLKTFTVNRPVKLFKQKKLLEQSYILLFSAFNLNYLCMVLVKLFSWIEAVNVNRPLCCVWSYLHILYVVNILILQINKK